MDLYDQALAFNTSPDDWVRGGDGVWERRPANPAHDPGSSRTSETNLSSLVSPLDSLSDMGQIDVNDETDTSSVSYIAAENINEAGGGENRSISPGTEKTISGRVTPHPQPLSMTETVAGIGHAHLHERQVHRRPTRLEETHDEYGERFVAHKRQLASGKLLLLLPYLRLGHL